MRKPGVLYYHFMISLYLALLTGGATVLAFIIYRTWPLSGSLLDSRLNAQVRRMAKISVINYLVKIEGIRVMKGTSGPTNLKECFTHLEEMPTAEELKKFSNYSENDLALTHFGLGLTIRNKWLHPKNAGLRQVINDICMIVEPDSMSHVIIKALLLHLNVGEIDVPKFQELLEETTGYFEITDGDVNLHPSIFKFLGPS